MAYVKRIVIKSTLGKAIDYITCGKKTDNVANMDVEKAVAYILSENKVAYVYGQNCASNSTMAFNQMQMLKKEFNKENKVLAHHYIQSFKPGELNSKTAHEIGKEFCEKNFPNCQVVFSTHIDKAHIHNHFVVNSVMLNGKKFDSSTKTLYTARNISNKITKKYNLSVIEPSTEKISKSNIYDFDQSKLTNKYELIKNDLDTAEKKANTFAELKQILKTNMNYSVSDNKYLSLKPPGYKKSVRSEKIGSHYSKENIKERIANKIILVNQNNEKLSDNEKQFIKIYGLNNLGNRLENIISDLKTEIGYIDIAISKDEQTLILVKELLKDILIVQDNKKINNSNEKTLENIISMFSKNNISVENLGEVNKNLEQRENELKQSVLNNEHKNVFLSQNLKTALDLNILKVQKQFDLENEKEKNKYKNNTENKKDEMSR